MTCSQSSLVTVKIEGNQWANELAKRIDRTISSLAEEREVISVAVTPIFTEHASTQAGYASAIKLVSSVQSSVIVTVVWRNEAGTS